MSHIVTGSSGIIYSFNPLRRVHNTTLIYVCTITSQVLKYTIKATKHNI